MGLNPRQLAFVVNYVKTKNGTRSAIAAGYSENGAAQTAEKLLRKTEIAKEVERRLKKLHAKSELSAERVLRELKKLAFADLSKAYDEEGYLLHPQKMPASVRASLQQVETTELYVGRGPTRKKIGRANKVKITDKVRALEMLAKHFKLLTDVQEVSGSVNVNLDMPANGSETEPDAD